MQSQAKRNPFAPLFLGANSSANAIGLSAYATSGTGGHDLPKPPRLPLVLPDLSVFQQAESSEEKSSYHRELDAEGLRMLCPPDVDFEPRSYVTNNPRRLGGLESVAANYVYPIEERMKLLPDLRFYDVELINTRYREARYLTTAAKKTRIGREGLAGRGISRTIPTHSQLAPPDDSRAYVAGVHGYNANGEVVFINNESSDWPHPSQCLAYAFQSFLEAGVPFAETVYLRLYDIDEKGLLSSERYRIKGAVLATVYAALPAPGKENAKRSLPQEAAPTTPSSKAAPEAEDPATESQFSTPKRLKFAETPPAQIKTAEFTTPPRKRF